MILTVDIGNTNIVLGCFDNGQIRFTARIATERKKTDMEYAVSFRNILELYHVDRTDIEGGIIACVVPVLSAVVSSALRLLTGKEPLVIGPGVRTGLTVVSGNMATLGNDQVADAVAAVEEYPAPMIIVDMGSANVLIAVDERKRFIGSVIAPGTVISATALAESCDALPQVALEKPRSILGTSTAESMKSGIVYGAAAMLDGMLQRIEEHIGAPCTVIATGGVAPAIVPYCRREMLLDPQLLLKGLYYIYKRNTRR